MEFKKLHERALEAANQFRLAEAELIEIFQEIDACSGYLELGFSSLHVYATKGLGLSDDCAYKFIRVERKAVVVPALKEKLKSGEITLSKAVVIAPVLEKENQNHWLELAKNVSKRELERAVAEVNPEKPKPEKVRPQGGGMARIEVSVSQATLELLERARELVEQKKGTSLNLAETLHALAEAFVKKEDPVRKADRNAHKTGPGASAGRHAVHRRDRGRCQFRHHNGGVCGARKWLHVHHRKPKSEGGSDLPENLVTLCSTHHRLVHSSP